MSASLPIIKFTGENWGIFKKKMRALLLHAELLECIDVKTDSDGSSKTTKISEEERRKMNRAYSILTLSLDDPRMQMMMHVEEGDAAGVWRTLVAHYERTSTASKAHTRSMLHKQRMYETEEFDMYKSRIVELKMRLATMGETVSEGELIYVILEGLPATYGALKQSLEVQDDYDFEKICGHIRDYQEKKKYQSKNEDEFVQESASYARGRHGGRESEDDRKNWPCRICKKVGHPPFECPMRKGSGYDCFKCGRRDHQMRDCPELRSGREYASTCFVEEDGWTF
jgi:hypothetical protein